eukprot:scaffold34183_cov58-Phaeocystis_antarctica.AAC.3
MPSSHSRIAGSESASSCSSRPPLTSRSKGVAPPPPETAGDPLRGGAEGRDSSWTTLRLVSVSSPRLGPAVLAVTSSMYHSMADARSTSNTSTGSPSAAPPTVHVRRRNPCLCALAIGRLSRQSGFLSDGVMPTRQLREALRDGSVGPLPGGSKRAGAVGGDGALDMAAGRDLCRQSARSLGAVLARS